MFLVVAAPHMTICPAWPCRRKWRTGQRLDSRLVSATPKLDQIESGYSLLRTISHRRRQLGLVGESFVDSPACHDFRGMNASATRRRGPSRLSPEFLHLPIGRLFLTELVGHPIAPPGPLPPYVAKRTPHPASATLNTGLVAHHDIALTV